MTDPARTLPAAHIPELPSPAFGKVRDCYDLADGRRILIASDRISAFDRSLAVIPWKGQVLTQTARFWFDRTAHICPNHVLAYPDPNVVLARRLAILPVEVVVRGYLAGTTGTSILTLYRQGARRFGGTTLPDGLRDNEALASPLVTPTSKAGEGGHDAPLDREQIVEQGLVSADLWAEVEDRALALFAEGQRHAASRGLILADTKYEFGLDADGTLRLADEIHTPDSSRYWRADGFEAVLDAGTRPPSFDKDVIRAWVAARCDPYAGPVPDIPPDMVETTSRTYIAAFEAITGAPFEPDRTGETPLARIRAALEPYFAPTPSEAPMRASLP